LAAALEAEPVLRDVTAIAAAARISLADIEAATGTATGALPGLTKREREIVTHIVAGRTYGEIARALFPQREDRQLTRLQHPAQDGLRQPGRPRAPGTARRPQAPQ
jgi:FixJ family two-component response regulator